jgi:MFS family permease
MAVHAVNCTLKQREGFLWLPQSLRVLVFCVCRWRGRLNTLVQCGTITGIVVASAVNIGTNHLYWGWRLSLAIAAIPGSILLLGVKHH